ncbi:MAG: nitroreductase family protein [Oscillospiraceae bacterium]|nr:nitroreductase family protein [Oscillospiraceae bacterium]
MTPALIAARRSIRRYQDQPLTRQELEAVLEAGRLAPSAKNRQPWRFIVAQGAAKAALVEALRAGLAQEAARPLLPQSTDCRGRAAQSFSILDEAPAAIVVVNPLGRPLDTPLDAEGRVAELCNAQSLGAALENMCLTAAALGLGSLWVCDTYFAHAALKDWAGIPGEPAAVLALGRPAEAPAPRPRLPLETITEWRG